MARKSLLQKNLKRSILCRKVSTKRSKLKKILRQKTEMNLLDKLQSIPRNGAKSRINRRCFVTGSPRNVLFCGLSRHAFREMAKEGLLPGVTKSSW